MVTIYKPVSMVTGSKPVSMVAIFKPVTLVNFVFVLFVMSKVNSYGHGGTVSSPNHTFPLFSMGKLEQAVNQYFMHILSLVTDNNPS